MVGRAARWEVEVYERKRNPDLKSNPVKVGLRMVPLDLVPTKLPAVTVLGSNIDEAMRNAKAELKRQGYANPSLNASAEAGRRLVAYVFEKESKR